MITTKLLIKKEKESKKGIVPIYLRVTAHRKAVFINTGIKIKKEDWNYESQTILKSYKDYKRANSRIQKLKVNIEEYAYDLDYREVRYTAKSLKDMFLNNRNEDQVITIARAWVKQRRESKEIARSSFEKYNGILDKLNDFTKGELRVHHITHAFLNKFKRYLIDKGNSDNTISSNLSFLRAICNHLIKSGFMNQNDYPFKGARLSYTSSRRKHLTTEQLSLFKKLVLPSGSKIKASRDIFLFCFQTGLRIGDALKLKVKDYDGTHISYEVTKTGDHSRLKCTTLAKEILDEYTTKKFDRDFVFNFLTREGQVDDISGLREKKNFTALINKNLAILSKRLELPFKVSTHWARHSLAVNGLLNGLSTENVMAILNHKNVQTTQIYAKIVDKMKDQSIDKFDLIKL